MMPVWENIDTTKVINIFGLATVATTVATFAARSLIMHFFNRNLEGYKLELKAKFDAEIERLKAQYVLEVEKLKDDLKRAAFERETKFGLLHAEIVKSIKEVYGPLNTLHGSVSAYLNPVTFPNDLSMEEKRKHISDNKDRLIEAFQKNRIILPKTVSKNIDTFIIELLSITNTFTVQTTIPDSDRGQAWVTALVSLQTKIDPISELMIDEVQELLGFPEYLPRVNSRNGTQAET